MSSSLRLLAVVLVAAPLPIAAQRVSPVGDLLAWVDSVGRATTATALDALRGNAAVWSGPERSLARGWWEVRRGVVTNNGSTVESGMRVLVSERSSQRGAPLPVYLLARGFHDLGVARAPVRSNLAQKDGETNADTFWRLLRPLIDAEPSYAPADRLATDALLALGDRTLRPDELELLAMLLRRTPGDPKLLIVEARRARALGAPEAALARLDAAQAAGGDRGVVGIERARTLAMIGQLADAETAYWSGTKELTAAGREAYRTDIAWFVHPDTLAPFDAVPRDSVPAWLRRFWLDRDALAANRPGERLQEQLLRWADAFRDYRVPLPWRRTQYTRVEFFFEEPDLCLNETGRLLQEELARLQPSLSGDVRGSEPLLDHRGLIVLRHGEPMQRVVGKPPAADSTDQKLRNRPRPLRAEELRALRMSESMRFNESWLYWFDGRWRTLSFRGSEALGTHASTTLMSYLPLANAIGEGFEADWLLRAGLSEEWARAEAWLREPRGRRSRQSLACDTPVRTAVHQQREDAVVAASVDSDTPPIRDPWPSAIQVYGLGDDAASGKALVALAIPRDRLEAARLPDGRFDHPVQIRVTAYDRATGRYAAIDTVVHFVASDPPSDRSFFSQLLELPLGTGNWRAAVKLTQESDTVGSYAVLPETSIGRERGLGMSDIVLGRVGGVSWRTPSGSNFAVNTVGTWSRNDEAEIYYEVYGARAGESLRTRIEIRSLEEGRGGDRVSASFSAVADGGRLSVERRLGLSQLRGGRYEVTVLVESETGSVTRRQRLIVTTP